MFYISTYFYKNNVFIEGFGVVKITLWFFKYQSSLRVQRQCDLLNVNVIYLLFYLKTLQNQTLFVHSLLTHFQNN